MEQIRLDKWLWAARFYKTRQLAQAAISGGKVHCNNSRVKPSKIVKLGDTVEIKRVGFSQVVEVIALSDKRGPAAVAATLYKETDASVAERQALQEQRKFMGRNPAPHKRPDKRDRKHIIRFQRKSES